MGRIPAKTALVGLLFASGAAAQQPTEQNVPPPNPTPPPPDNTPGAPTGAPATMQTVTVTGSRPSEDFLVKNPSINRLGAENLMDGSRVKVKTGS